MLNSRIVFKVSQVHVRQLFAPSITFSQKVSKIIDGKEDSSIKSNEKKLAPREFSVKELFLVSKRIDGKEDSSIKNNDETLAAAELLSMKELFLDSKRIDGKEDSSIKNNDKTLAPGEISVKELLSDTGKTDEVGNIYHDLNTPTLTVKKLFMTLQELSKIYKRKPFDFNRDVTIYNFPGLLKPMRYINKISPKSIYHTLENLYFMEVRSDNFLLKIILNQSLLILPQLSPTMVVKLFSLIAKQQTSKEEEEVLKLALNELNLRYKEFKHPYEFITIYENSEHFTSEFFYHLDDIIVEVCAHFTIKELVKLLSCVCKSGKRPKSLVRALALDLEKSPDPFDEQQICDIFYALARLNLPEMPLINRLFSDLSTKIDDIQSHFIISSILSSIGHMRIRNNFFDKISLWVSKNLEKCSHSLLTRYLLTLANVHYGPPNSVLLNRIIGQLDFKNLEDSTAIEVVWSLSILNEATEEQISSILDKYPTIEKFPKDVGLKLKLLNINAASSLIPSHDRKISNYDFIAENLSSQLTKSKSEGSLISYIQSCLSVFLPAPKYLATNVLTPLGFVIPALALYNKEGKPIQIDKYSPKALNIVTDELPEDVFKIAFLVFNYKDYTVIDQTLTGTNHLLKKLLKANQVNVVEIPYWSINTKEKLASAKTLERQIKRILDT